MTQELFDYMTNIQNGYAKEYLIVTRLHPRVPDSLVHPKYTYNYLNLPQLSYGAPIEETQVGGGDEYYKKYIKYKTKYLMRK